MYSAARVNQFDRKDTFYEFVINVSQQDNNGKIKLSLNINLQRLQPYFLCEINNNTPGFHLVLGIFMTL